MNNQTKQNELEFLLKLKYLSAQSLFRFNNQYPNFPEDFNIDKALITLNRMINNEIEFLQKNTNDYLDRYC